MFQISDHTGDILETPFYLRDLRKSFEHPTKSMPYLMAA